MRRIGFITGLALLLVGVSIPTSVSAVKSSGRSPVTQNPWISFTPDAITCVDVLLIGYRGSGDRPVGFNDQGKQTGDALPWSSRDYIRLGKRKAPGSKSSIDVAQDQLGRTIGNLYREVRRFYQKKNLSTGFFSVGISEIPLLGPPGAPTTSLYYAPAVPRISPGAWTRYLSSITGDALVQDSTRRIMSAIAAKCPKTKFLVAGYSQGAIMARSLVASATKDASVATKITGLLLVADPLFRRDDAQFSLAFDNDYSTDGFLLSPPACGPSLSGKFICGLISAGPKNPISNVAVEVLVYRELLKDLLSTGVAHYATEWRRLGVLCDSGDLICSPVRVRLGKRVESDIPRLLLEKTKILGMRHVKYGNQSARWWQLRVEKWLG